MEPWDPRSGVPINQLQLLGTLFSFGVMGVKALQRSGVRLGRRTGRGVHPCVEPRRLPARRSRRPPSLSRLRDSKALWDLRASARPTDPRRQGAHRGPKSSACKSCSPIYAPPRAAGERDPALPGQRDRRHARRSESGLDPGLLRADAPDRPLLRARSRPASGDRCRLRPTLGRRIWRGLRALPDAAATAPPSR